MGETAERTRRVLLVDDHPVVRQGLALLLAQEGFVVCGEADEPAEGLQAVAVARPDLVVLDLSFGDESGLGAIPAFCDQGVPVLVYSMHEDALSVQRAFAAGARGYVAKRDAANVLVEAARAVIEGEAFASPRVAGALAVRLSGGGMLGSSPELSAREREVFRCLGRGDTTAEIAAGLGLSPRTVESYYARIISKLDLAGTGELRRQAIRRAGAPPDR